MSLPTSHHLIDGKDIPGPSTFTVTSPETNKPVTLASQATSSIIDEALASSSRAFLSWSATSYIARRDLFNRAADLLLSRGPEIAEAMMVETGAKRDWCEGGNVKGAVSVLREVAGLASHIKGEVIPSMVPGTMTLVTREAVGVVFAIAPWNAPVILSCRAVAVAIMCGNTVVLKSSECSPRTQRFVAEVFRDAGFPPGVLNYINMDVEQAPELTERIIADKVVKRVNFTGSDRVGRIIAGHCASYGPKQCVLELGGKAAAIVLEDADLDAAADAITFSSMYHSGQICYSTENVIAVPAIADALVEKLRSRIEKLWSGPSPESKHQDNIGGLRNDDGEGKGEEGKREEKYRLGPLFRESAAANAASLLSTAITDGAHLLIGTATHTGCFLQPHLLDHLPPTTPLFTTESFAPICAVTRATSNAHALELANQNDFSLTAGVYGSGDMKTLEVARGVRAGAVHVNGPTVSFESNRPYGGLGGRSGYGRFGGMAGVDEYTDRKVLTLNVPGGVGLALV